MKLEVHFTKREFWLPLAVGLLLTVCLYFLGALLSGGGHSLTAITIFFPYSLVLGEWLKDTRWEFVAAVALLLQFPLYGLLLAWSRESGRVAMLLMLLIVHSSGVLIGLRGESSRRRLYTSGGAKSGVAYRAGGLTLGGGAS